MKRYYVNKNAQANGDHEVHDENCYWLPNETNRMYLDYFSTCEAAVREARKHYRQVNGCIHCSKPCHTT
ncbi:MAG: hypothetical protein WBH03_07190, partial [Cyclobacteriaceae bacterium]